MNREDAILQELLAPHKVTFTLSNLQIGSRYALINSNTGEVIEQGTAEFPEVNLYVDPGIYDVRVRKAMWLPFSFKDTFIGSDTKLHITQAEDQIFLEPFEQQKPNMHDVFDDAMFLLFGDK